MSSLFCYFSGNGLHIRICSRLHQNLCLNFKVTWLQYSWTVNSKMSCDFSDLPKSILLDIFRPVFRFWLECHSKNFNKCSILDRYSDAIWNPKFSSKQQLFTVWILDPSMRQTETSSWKRVFNVLDCTIKHSL